MELYRAMARQIARCEPLQAVAAEVRRFGYRGQVHNGTSPEDEFLHQAFRVLMLRRDLAARACERTGLDSKIIEQLLGQAEAFRACLTTRGFPNIVLEVPVITTDKNGSTISATVDCLAHGDGGLAIIDHKSDAEENWEDGFLRHWPQLDAYRRAIECLSPDIKVETVGIHWLGAGALTSASL